MRSRWVFVFGFLTGALAALIVFYSAGALRSRNAPVFVPPPAVARATRVPETPPPPSVSPPPLPAVPRIATDLPSTDGSDAPELALPVDNLKQSDLRDTFNEEHFGHKHEAIDIMEPKGTPVRAVSDGTIVKLFLSKPGGNTIYQFDNAQVYCYYYAHLDRYADNLREGMKVSRGDVIGFVGYTGDASPNAPHLHFEIHRLGAAKHWYEGVPLNPYTVLARVAGM